MDPKKVLSAEELDDGDVETQSVLSAYISLLPEPLKDVYHKTKMVNLVSTSD